MSREGKYFFLGTMFGRGVINEFNKFKWIFLMLYRFMFYTTCELTAKCTVFIQFIPSLWSSLLMVGWLVCQSSVGVRHFVCRQVCRIPSTSHCLPAVARRSVGVKRYVAPPRKAHDVTSLSPVLCCLAASHFRCWQLKLERPPCDTWQFHIQASYERNLPPNHIQLREWLWNGSHYVYEGRSLSK